MKCWTIALLALALAGGGTSQDRVSCERCGSHGEIDCGQHRGELLELERGVLHCSVAIGCRKCAGALTVDCKECTNPRVEAARAKRSELAAAWLAERRETIAAHCIEPDEVLFLSTAHCELAFTLAATTVGRSKLDPHRLMHLHGQRIEELRAKFLAAFELDEGAFPREAEDVSPRLFVHMFEDARDQRAISPRVTGIGSRGTGVKLMGATLAYSMVRDPRTMRNDTDVHRNLVHNVTHLLLSSMEPTVWIGNRGHGWLDEGVAHWFEEQVDGRCANFCYEEVGVAPGANWKNGKWRVGIRQEADANRLLRFTELYQKNSDELDFQAHAHAFAWVDFLIATQGGRKFGEFLKRVKGGEASRDAMTAVFGFGPLAFDEAFESWVEETYPPR